MITLAPASTQFDILAGSIVNAIYAFDDFITHPENTPGLPVGRTIESVVMGKDPIAGSVAFGLLTDGPEGKILALRGTELPKGDCDEWLRNLDAILVTCPFAYGTKWHDGIGADYLGLTIDGQPLSVALAGIPLSIVGHSKGAALAIYAGSQIGAATVVSFASPKPGDAAFAAFALSRIGALRLYANPKDIVPHLPLTIPLLEDYVFPGMLIPIDARSLVPPIGDSLGDRHSLGGCYLRVLSAL